ncbi:type II toxin-antitoxin system Phd/YefM family antitoxin [Candidatus Roizmanbacteria bacterium]|nr:type II toxin-antitoxin system Phd/YefM family antitoxin [Candidatus Roizmanbacteria bacterium]
MDTSINTSTITDLRHKTNKVLQKAEEKGYVYLLRRSKVAAAVVDVKYLNALQEAYEDYLDTLEFDKTIKLKRIPLIKAKKSK